ncbi:PsbB mRNA maturation factor Mbb1, chloroplastic [Porphyridium purpureum]|uniref:PsbB mRNA maturation factor Mbb1, chloroplastic n=1 Tax=Porphyridium purpureum TaxID=35688 RepID=A0A5J4ZA58_PORPP|nr:PsbB mRNA maturation factor Mbb1, chloroplastic [Porphyridium purpureum]|eukprot:POR7021..scf295_1
MMEGKRGPRESLQVLKRALRADPENPKLFQTAAKLALRSRSYRAAVRYLQRGIEVASDGSAQASLLAIWAQVELALENEAGARQLFRDALRVDKRCTRAYVGWARMEIRSGAYERASRLLSACVLRGGGMQSARVMQTAGYFEMLQGAYGRARECFERAVALSASEAVPSIFGFLMYARMEAYLGNDARAREVLTLASERFQRHSRPEMLLALLALRRDDLEAAKLHASRALARQPKKTVLWTLLGQIECRLGNVSRARAIFIRACEQNRSDWYVRHCWSALEWDQPQPNVSLASSLCKQSFALRDQIRFDFCPLTCAINDHPDQYLFRKLIIFPVSRTLSPAKQ